jgi:transposase
MIFAALRLCVRKKSIRGDPDEVIRRTQVMPAPLSLDLRERVVDAYERKEGTEKELAQRFGVSVNSVSRWKRLKETTQSLAPQLWTRGRKRSIDDEGAEILKSLVEETPDATIEDLKEAYINKTGITVSDSSIKRCLKRLKLTRKKKLFGLRNRTANESRG